MPLEPARTAFENAVREVSFSHSHQTLYLADARIQPIARPEPHTGHVGLSDQAFVRDVIHGNAVVELADDSGSVAPGRRLRGRTGAPLTIDEALIRVLVLEQD